ncbi:MAG TPA: acyl-CoA thioesterase [Nannocystis exedens]|nr:acyl-CoA thioesterase [Nannocystis exedens]
MSAIFDHHHRVTAAEIDFLGHANNLCYLSWMQDAALAHSSAQGWPPQRYRELGAVWVVRTHAVEYLRPARVDDELVIRTWVVAIGRIDSVRRYQILRASDGVRLVQAETRWIWIDIAAERPRRVPAEIRAAFPLAQADGTQSLKSSDPPDERSP